MSRALSTRAGIHPSPTRHRWGRASVKRERRQASVLGIELASEKGGRVHELGSFIER